MRFAYLYPDDKKRVCDCGVTTNYGVVISKNGKKSTVPLCVLCAGLLQQDLNNYDNKGAFNIEFVEDSENSQIKKERIMRRDNIDEFEFVSFIRSFFKMNIYGKIWLLFLLCGFILIWVFVDSSLIILVASIILLSLWIFVRVLLKDKIKSH